MKKILYFILLFLCIKANAQLSNTTGVKPRVRLPVSTSGDSLIMVDGNGYLFTIHKNNLGIGALPAGSDTYIQYNNAGAFGAEADFLWQHTINRLVIGVASNTNEGLLIGRNTSGSNPFMTLDDDNSAGFIQFGDGISSGFLPYLIFKPDGTTANHVIFETRVNDSGSPAAHTFRVTNYAGSGALATKHLFDFDNNGTLALRIKANYDVLFRGKIYTYNNATPTNGQFFIGHTANGTYEVGTLVSADGSVVVTNNAGSIDLASQTFGTYTPTLTGEANTTGTTAFTTNWTKTGDFYEVWGQIEIDPTTTLTLTQVGFSLPVATSLTNDYDIGSTASDGLGTSVRIYADGTNDRARFEFTPTDVTNRKFSFYIKFKFIAP